MTVVDWDEEPYEDDDTPLPPPPEFDPDAGYALASPGLSSEERADIIREARSLRASGLTREALCNWICRKVALTVGLRSGFEMSDSEGKIIDPPHTAAARKQFKSEAGRKRQAKRNADIEQWRQRCQQLINAGQPARTVWERCWVAINGTYLNATGERIPIPLGFEGLPALYGLKGKSRPRKRRLRERLYLGVAPRKSASN